jgi:hypothetical protein
LDSLDYIYMPSRDVAADMAWFVEKLGAQVVFAIDGMGARVAMLKMGRAKPPLLLADHVAGDAPALVYRVADLDAASTMDQFVRAGTILQYFYKFSVGAGSSYEYAQSDSNFKWFFENINYRVKSWMGAQQYQNGAWQLGPNAYCTYAANL